MASTLVRAWDASVDLGSPTPSGRCIVEGSRSRLLGRFGSVFVAESGLGRPQNERSPKGITAEAGEPDVGHTLARIVRCVRGLLRDAAPVEVLLRNTIDDRRTVRTGPRRRGAGRNLARRPPDPERRFA